MSAFKTVLMPAQKPLHELS